jgi:glyoxylase-like metal-dependent hydrolase (beta-lactamase superfamily II)
MAASAATPAATTIAPGLVRVDTGYLRPAHTASYLVIEGGRAAIVDTGVGRSAAVILEALSTHGIDRAAVEWVIPTHVHLDHAGGAGPLMDALPNARLAVHPSGRDHLVDPSRLEAGVRALYGDAFFDREYAPVVPVPSERIVALADGDRLDLAGRPLDVVHTPGHAWHQLSVLDTDRSVLIAGDAFGASYPGYAEGATPFLVPVVPPPQFDPAAYRQTLERIRGLQPRSVAPAHFPLIDAPAAAADRLESLLDEALDWTAQAESVDDLQQRLIDGWAASLPAGASRAAFERDFGLDLWLTAEGLWHWREKKARRASS